MDVPMHSQDTGLPPGFLEDSVIDANGVPIDLSNPELAKAKFAVVKAKAISAGVYEGKSLEWLKGGRSQLLYDQLLVDGHSPELAKKIIADNFQHQVERVISSGSEGERLKLKAFFESRRH